MAMSIKPMRVLRIVGAVAVVVWLFSKAGVERVEAHLLEADPRILALAALAALLEGCTRVLNWQQLLRSMHAVTSGYLRLVSTYYYSALLGQFVPSTVGTDAIRVALSQRTFGGSHAIYAASLVVLNGVTLFAGAVVALAGIAVLSMLGEMPYHLLVVVPILLGLAICLPLFYSLLHARRDVLINALRRMRRKRWFGLRRGLRRFVDALLVFERAGGDFRIVLLTSTMVVLVQASMTSLTGMAFGIDVPLAAWLALPTIIAVIGLLPLSVFGFGAQQGAVVLVLTSLGVDAPLAFACALVIAFLSTSVFLLCGAVALATWQGPVPDLKSPRQQEGM